MPQALNNPYPCSAVHTWQYWSNTSCGDNYWNLFIHLIVQVSPETISAHGIFLLTVVTNAFASPHSVCYHTQRGSLNQSGLFEA